VESLAVSEDIIRDLGSGLILRRATVADTEKLVAFQGDVQREPGTEEPEKHVAAWARDLMRGDHPAVSVGDFTLVEDSRTAAVVSSLCLISQTWSYGGVEFGVGRPELVGTHPAYRRQGLVRAQFEVIHQWSAERGEKLQAVTGIPWYYRQFGYEMALSLGGGRACYKPQVPKHKGGETEPYRVRGATEADLSFIAQVYEHATRRYPVACVRDEALWRYELSGKSSESVTRQALSVIETAEGEPVGFLAHASRLWRGRVGVDVYALRPGVSWLAVTPSVLRHLWALGEQWAAQDPAQEMKTLVFWLGEEHPVYKASHDRLPRTSPSYAWYVRVADVAGFVQHIAPVLERRLGESPLVGHSGELAISFYRRGLRLVFDKGRLADAQPWQPTPEKRGNAGFPDLTFLQLLFGYRSLPELRYAFADCWAAGDEARALLEALFPRRPSDVWAVS
jgi:hypothetical protein